MNILIVIPSDKNCGPVNVVKYLLKAAMSKNGDCNFFVLCLSKKTGFDFFKTKTFYLDMDGFLARKAFYQNLLQENKIDVVHSHGIRPDLLNFLFTPRSLMKISTIHNYLNLDYKFDFGVFMGQIYTFLHLFILRRLDRVVGCSNSVTDNLKRFSVNATSIRNGVIKSELPKVRKNNEELSLLFLGRLVSIKNPIEFLKATLKLKELRNIKVYVVGEGDKNYIKKLSLEYPHVELLGDVNNPNEYIAKSDILVSTSRSEGFPLSVLESLYLGKKVILSDIEPHKEIVEMVGKVASCYKLGEIDSLVNAILTAENYIEPNPEKVKYLVSAERMLNEYMAIYKTVNSSE